MEYHSFKFILILLVTALWQTLLSAQKTTMLFNPGKKNEWHIYTSKSGKDNDTQHVFQFEKNVLHVSGKNLAIL
jgi:hypothetical protein